MAAERARSARTRGRATKGRRGGWRVSLGALFIMFGVSQTRADKGMEIVKQSLVGLAILIGGILIKEVVVGLVFKKPPGTPGGGSSVC